MQIFNTSNKYVYSKHTIKLTHFYLYKILQIFQIFQLTSKEINITIDSNVYTYTKINDFTYKLNTSCILPKNNQNIISISNTTNTVSITGVSTTDVSWTIMFPR